MNVRTFTVAIDLLFFTGTGWAGPLDTWTWRNPLPTGNTISAVAYGGGQFVTVGELGTVQTSSDGRNWVVRPSGTTNWLRQILYINEQFITVGDLGTVLTSVGAVNWIRHETGTTNDLYGLAYGGNQFVAVGQHVPDCCEFDGTILISADGTNWVERPSLPGFSLRTILYGDGVFVASGQSYDGPSFLFTSTDGVNWNRAGRASVSQIAYGNGQFVAVGSPPSSPASSTGIMTSTEGTNWVQSASVTNWLGGVLYANGQFFVATTSTNIMVSSDAVHWVPHHAEFAPSIIAYGNGVFVGMGGRLDRFFGAGNGILTSPDGVNWIQHQLWASDLLKSVAYGGGQFVAVGGFSGCCPFQSRSSILTSGDGVNWMERRPDTTNMLSCITHGNGQFVAVGDAGTIITSADGVNWIQHASGTTNALNSITHGDGQYVAVGGWTAPAPNCCTYQSGSAIVTSVDGVNWTERQPGTTNQLVGIAYGGGRFIAVGHNLVDGEFHTVLASSTDALTWTEQQSRSGGQAIAYGNGQFVVVGSGGTVATSADGVNWIQRQPRIEDSLHAIAYGNGHFVAAGQEPGSAWWHPKPFVIWTSANGVDWVQSQLAVSSYLSGFAYGNGHFVAVGGGGTILQSGSIITLALTPAASPGLLKLSLEGPTGLAHTIQSSTDLVSWRNVTNITTTQPSTVFLDALPAGFDRLFYRAYSQ